MRRSVLALLLLSRLAAADCIDDAVRAEMKWQLVPGVAVGVMRVGRPLRAKGYGFANVEHKVRVKPETVFQSASVGKQFTAAAVLKLVEEGKMGLDDPIAKYLADPPAAWRKITVRHLLTHTSGVANYSSKELDYRGDYTEDDLRAKIAALPLEFEPGNEFRYSNSGYLLLGLIIRKASGEFYGDYLRRRIFGPAGMTTARVMSEADIVPNRAAGYRLEKVTLKNQDWVSPELNTTADGSLYLTVLDFAKWEKALRGTTVLSRASLDRMVEPGKLNDGSPTDYALGWRLAERRGHRLVEHGGAWQGFRAHFLRAPADGLAVVVLANLASADAGRIASRVAGCVVPALAPEDRKPIADTEPAVATKVRELLVRLAAGKLEGSGLPPGKAEKWRDKLEVLPAPRSVRVVERWVEEGTRYHVFLVDFGTVHSLIEVVYDASGRLEAMESADP